MLGYTPQTSATERDWEKKFQDGIVANNIRENMRRLSARPHHVGSPYDKDNAEWMLARFKEWGLDAHIESFDVLFPTPKERSLEMISPKPFKAKMQEPVLAVDPTSNQTSEQLPTYNAYSADGDVTGPLVYVNFGNREDYDELDRLGVSTKGAIVIARYGSGWRGVKPKVAAEHGAVGCIIYSDPREDGFFYGSDYPTGGWRSKDGVQRGSVMDTDYPGDPLTPGVGAIPGAKRLAIKDAKTITKIPVLPISYADAQPFLEALQGQIAPEGWRGGLPMTYHVGPGPARVHLKVASNWDTKPLYDVIATIPGSSPDQWVIRGNHHDAWVNGADDPIAGMAPELEEARMFGELHKQGWTPKRTIIYCAWDGEEPGLLGSVEWVETHRDDLQKHAVLYLNTDGNERGFFGAGGTQDLQPFISGVARDINDPEKNISVFQGLRGNCARIGFEFREGLAVALGAFLQKFQRILHRRKIHIRRDSFDRGRNISLVRVGGGSEDSFFEFEIALGEFVLLVFQKFLQIGFIFRDGFGLRRIVVRKQIGIGEAHDGGAGCLGERASVGKVVVGEVRVPVEIVVDRVILIAFIFAAESDIE